jgi:hypothetical protein
MARSSSSNSNSNIISSNSPAKLSAWLCGRSKTILEGASHGDTTTADPAAGTIDWADLSTLAAAVEGVTAIVAAWNKDTVEQREMNYECRHEQRKIERTDRRKKAKTERGKKYML